MSTFVQDVRCAVRQIAGSPVVALAVVASLGLGIGATTAVFSLIDTLLLRPLAALDAAEELVSVRSFDVERPERLRPLSYADYLDYAATEEIFTGLAAFAATDFTLTHDGPSERLSGLAVSANYFSVLGVEAAAGRLLLPGEGAASPVVVLGYGLWQRRFGGDPGVVGQAITVNGRRLTVAGVAAPSFPGTSRISAPELWVPLEAFRTIATGPLATFAGELDRKQQWLATVGRLAPGVSLEQAKSALEIVAARLEETYPEVDEGRRIRVFPLAELALGEGNRESMARYSSLLLGVVAVVLLIACINVAGLLLARGLSRQREVAIRTSLGAGRLRLLRQLLTESFVLALLGGVAGTALAAAVLPLLERLKLPVEAVYTLALDARLLGFALAVTLVTGLGFGLVPALRGAFTVPAAILRGGENAAPRRLGRLRAGWNDLLVVVQVALALVILVAAVLFVRTLRELEAVEPGFHAERILTAKLDLGPAGYEGARVTEFYGDLTRRLRALPGVEDASLAGALPIVGAEVSVELTVTAEGAVPAVEGGTPPGEVGVHHALVGPGFFRVLGTELRRGRECSERDGAEAVAVVNQEMARTFWPGQDPLGRRVTLIQDGGPFTVVGVAADSRNLTLRQPPAPTIYLCHAQHERWFIGSILAPSMTLVVRTAGDPRAVAPAVRSAVREKEAHLPVFHVMTLRERLAEGIGIERQAAALFSAFAALALVLTMVGLYGVIHHAVVRRGREIAIRMALGARPESVLALVLRRGALLALAGVAAGLAVALPLRGAVESRLFGVAANDPVTYFLAAAGLVAVALLVSLVPARRAARIDPAVTLQEE